MQKITSLTAAVALGIERKVLDNILSRDGRHLLPSGRQGRSRRLPFAALETLAIALLLHRDLRVPLSRGFELAESLRSSQNHEIGVGRLGKLRFDLDRLVSSLEQAVAEAIDEIHPPRRGRPVATS